jgi:hypothetical protein
MRTLLRGIVAGLVGTAAMTLAQLAAARLRGEQAGTDVPRSWSEGPAPANDVPRLTNTMHWTYGTGLGVLYALAARVLRPNPLPGGLWFGVGVWSASYAQLVPLGIYESPWRYPVDELALDLSYHLVYGAAVGEAFARF